MAKTSDSKKEKLNLVKKKFKEEISSFNRSLQDYKKNILSNKSDKFNGDLSKVMDKGSEVLQLQKQYNELKAKHIEDRLAMFDLLNASEKKFSKYSSNKLTRFFGKFKGKWFDRDQRYRRSLLDKFAIFEKNCLQFQEYILSVKKVDNIVYNEFKEKVYNSFIDIKAEYEAYVTFSTKSIVQEPETSEVLTLSKPLKRVKDNTNVLTPSDTDKPYSPEDFSDTSFKQDLLDQEIPLSESDFEISEESSEEVIFPEDYTELSPDDLVELKEEFVTPQENLKKRRKFKTSPQKNKVNKNVSLTINEAMGNELEGDDLIKAKFNSLGVFAVSPHFLNEFKKMSFDKFEKTPTYEALRNYWQNNALEPLNIIKYYLDIKKGDYSESDVQSLMQDFGTGVPMDSNIVPGANPNELEQYRKDLLEDKDFATECFALLQDDAISLDSFKQSINIIKDNVMSKHLMSKMAYLKMSLVKNANSLTNLFLKIKNHLSFGNSSAFKLDIYDVIQQCLRISDKLMDTLEKPEADLMSDSFILPYNSINDSLVKLEVILRKFKNFRNKK